MKRYNRLLMLLFATLTVTSVSAQYAPILWDTSGVNLRQGHHTQWDRAGAHDPVTGDMVYTWSDCREGYRDVYAQKIDVNGNVQWDEGGKLIISDVGRQEDPEVIYVGDGNWIISWIDFRNAPANCYSGDVYAQKVDSDGDPLWNPAGLLVNINPEGQINLHLISDGTGGLLVFWQGYYPEYTIDNIYAQHVLSNGEVDPAWPTDGLVVIHEISGQEELTVCTDGQGGAIVAWEDQRSVTSTGKDIYAQRVTPDGSLLWALEGAPICTLDSYQRDPELCQDGEGGAYIVWEDTRWDPYHGDLYFQRINSLGNPVYEDTGRVLCNANMEQRYCQIMYSDDGGAIFTWQDYRLDPYCTVSDIYTQKVDPSGNYLWGNNGLLVCNADEMQGYPHLTTDGTGGAIIAWEDQREFGNPWYSDVYVQRISSTGTPLWTANGVVVCDAIHWQRSVTLKPDGNQGAFFFWADIRSGSTGLYLQHHNSAGVPQLPQNGLQIHSGIDYSISNPQMIPVGNGERILVVWMDNRYGWNTCLVLQIIDSEGNSYLEENGVPLCTPDTTGYMDDLQLISDLQGGALLVWKDNRISNQGFNQIFAQRLESDGSSTWIPGGVHIFPIIEEQERPYIAGDENGGAFVAWSGIVPGPSYMRIYAQHLDASGNQTWRPPVQVSADTLEDICRSAVPDGEGGVIIAWYGGVYGDYNVFAQKLDANGNALWQAGGLEVCNAQGNQRLPNVIPDGSGGAVFAWEDRRNFVDRNIFAQRVDRFGNLVWADSGLVICDAPNNQQGIQMESDSAGNIFIIWADYRSDVDSDVYVQKVTPSGQLLFPINGISICDDEGEQSYPKMISDTEDGVYIAWQDDRNYFTAVSDIYCTHINGNGEFPDPVWVENGNIVNSEIYWQWYPAIVSDGDGGAIVAWEDGRASEHEFVFNLFMQRVNDFSTSVEPEEPDPVPVKFSLEQNYPNPFNPATRIRYNLSHTSHVTLAIYDILGRKVHTLQNQVMTSGSHQVIWDGKNSSGTYASSGIYFYKLDVGGDSKIRKMVLLK